MTRILTFTLCMALALALLPSCEPPPDGPVYHISAWVPWTHLGTVQDSLQSQLGTIETAHVFWYELASDGSIDEKSYADPALVTQLQGEGILVIPTMSDGFASGRAHGVFSDAGKRQQHIDDIVALVLSKGYDGIDLDYEAMGTSTRDLFSAFIEDLAARLHAEGKLLTLAVYPKTSAPGGWSGPRSHDYTRLGAAADRLNIMGYGYGYSGGPPNPIGPIHWLRRVLDFAVTVVPPEKLFMGIPFYSRDWATGQNGTALTDDQVKDRIATYDPQISYDPEDGEESFTYTKSGVGHTVWFQSARGIADKLQLVKDYGLGGMNIWRLGREDPAFWDAIRATLKDGSQP